MTRWSVRLAVVVISLAGVTALAAGPSEAPKVQWLRMIGGANAEWYTSVASSGDGRSIYFALDTVSPSVYGLLAY